MFGLTKKSEQLQDADRWRSIGASPIRPDAPSGDSARNDPAYGQVQDEIKKLSSLSGETVAWAEIIPLSTEIIEKKSKDLIMGTSLCLALYHQKGYEGLAGGFALLEGMIENFWASLYPEAKRMKGRINALEWLGEKGGGLAAKKKPKKEDRTALYAALDGAKSLEGMLSEKMGKDSPGLGDLRRAIEEYAAGMPLEEEKAPSTISATIPDAPVSTLTSLSPQGIQSKEECQAILKEASERLRAAAEFTRAQEASLAWPYAIMRAITWMDIEPPQSEPNGETMIPPPPGHLLDQFRALADQKEWMLLLNQAEDCVNSYPFWLDPHRFSAHALEGLHNDAAQKAIEAACSGLIRQFPTLLTTKFSDGMPFADEETCRWLQSHQGGEKTEGGSAGDAALRLLQEEADELARAGKMKKAVSLLGDAIRQASSSRDRFVLRLALARLCMQKGFDPIALLTLEVLYKEVQQYAVAEWEPSLAKEALLLYRRMIEKNVDDPAQNELKRAVDRALCQIDPMGMMDLLAK